MNPVDKFTHQTTTTSTQLIPTVSEPNDEPKPDAPDTLDKPRGYRAHLNLKDRTDLDLDAFGNHPFDMEKSAARVTWLASNPS